MKAGINEQWRIFKNMDIQSEYRHRKLIKTSVGVYDLNACRWRAMGQGKKKKEITTPHSRGYLHQAAIIKNTIFTVIGPDEVKPHATLHSYNLKSHQWKIWEDCSMPTNRDSFGLTVFRNELFLFGGSNHDTQFNDLHIFNTLNGFWKQSNAALVSPRNPLIFTSNGSDYILLYGGINVERGEIYNDAYLFIDDEWVEIKEIIGAPHNLIGAKAAFSGKTLYMFGGEYCEDGVMKENNSLYTITVNTNERSLHFNEVVPLHNCNKKPKARVGHSLCGLGSEYLLLMGGQSIQSQCDNKMLRDIWIFDILSCAWSKIDPVNGVIRPLCENSLVVNNNQVLIFGGITEQLDMWNEQILCLQFGQNEMFKSEICTNCIQRAVQKEKEEKAFPKTIVLSSGFFYTISLEIKHPFQAISILYDCAIYLKATRFQIGIMKSLNENEHIEIEFDGQTLTKSQFGEMICHSSSADEDFSKFMTNIKVASMRLGKTFVFITADDNERKVFMFSADSKVTPFFDECYGFFSYSENIKTEMIESHQGKIHKNLILNVLRSRVANPQEVLNLKNVNKIYIFQKNILVTSEKVYYYELISNNYEDISIYKNVKKVQFLDELGYEISKEPELSLKSYVSNLRLNLQKYPTFSINNSASHIQGNEYLKKLRLLENSEILAIEMPTKIQDIQLEVSLYIAQAPVVIENNLGILIYFEDRLVNRLDVNFGDLFKEQFYKTKFKKAVTLFEFMGVINVKKGLVLNYFGNWFKKNRGYYLFIEGIREAMRKAKLDKLERQLKMGVEEDDRRIYRRVK